MKPGRELDALVAEKIFGLKVVRNKKGAWSLGDPDYYDDRGSMELSNPLPSFSDDILSAWEIVDTLFLDGWYMQLEGSESYGKGKGGFDVKFICKCGARGTYIAEAAVAPYAICLAALKAVKAYPNEI
jgi:hypothetical protein